MKSVSTEFKSGCLLEKYDPWSFIKMWKISCLVEGPVILQDRLCCMEFISWLAMAVAVAGYFNFIFSISVL